MMLSPRLPVSRAMSSDRQQLRAVAAAAAAVVRVRREHVHVPRARRQISLRGERFYTQPWGLYGGLAGAAATASIERADGARVP